MIYVVIWLGLMITSPRLGMLAIPFIIWHAVKEADPSLSSSTSKRNLKKSASRHTRTRSSHKQSSLSSTVKKSSSMAKRMR